MFAKIANCVTPEMVKKKRQKTFSDSFFFIENLTLFVAPATHSKSSQKGRICSNEKHLLLDQIDTSGRYRCLGNKAFRSQIAIAALKEEYKLRIYKLHA